MTATTTEAAVTARVAERVAAGVAGVAEEAKGCQGRNTQRGGQCQDTNANGRHWHGDGIGGDGGGGGGGGAGGDEDKTHQHQHYHSDKTPQHHHDNSKSRYCLQNNHHHHQQSHEDEAAYQMVPPDGGWGWMVALGTFIIMTLLPMLATCFGVLFSEYLLGEGSSSTTTAWIFNLQCFLWNMSGLLTRPLTQEFGWRLVALTTSIMAAAGLMISALTPSPFFLFFSFSLLTGIGGGVVTCQCFTILPNYFQRRRGLANGIMMSGICMGQLVGPPVTRFLQAFYGFRGATLILGALALNACVGASFFHPFEWHQRKVPLEKKSEEDTPVTPIKPKVVGSPDLTRGLAHTPSDASFPSGAAEGETEDGFVVRARLLERPGGRRTSCSSSRQSSRFNSTLSLSHLDVGSFAALPVEEEPEKEGEEGREDILPVRVVKTLIKDLGAMKSLRVCILCLGDTMCINGYINFIMMVPFAMLDAGFSPEASAWCISLSAACNMVTRFLVCALSDWSRFNMRLVYMCGFALIASTIFAFTLMSSVKWLMVTMALYGIGVGANMSIYNIIIIDVMGVERLGPVFGAACFFSAIGFICIGPFIGFIRDVTQSYAASMRMTSGMLLVGLTGWLFMGVAERVDRRREEGKTLTEALQKA